MTKSQRIRKPWLKRLLPVIMILWVIVMGSYVYFVVLGNPQSSPTRDTLVHYHVWLQLIVDEVNFTNAIPAGIGMGPALWKNHTLDSYGYPPERAPIFTEIAGGPIHVELTRIDGAILRGLVLKDFFNIWGRQLTTDCIEIDRVYCMDTSHITTVIVPPEEPGTADDPKTIAGPAPSAELKGRLSAANTTLIRVTVTTTATL